MESEEESRRRLYLEEMEQRNKVTPKSFSIALLFYVGVGLVVIFLFAVLTGIVGGPSGNDPSKECFNYEKANGDWANSCDQ